MKFYLVSISFFLFFLSPSAGAEVVVAPEDLPSILRTIGEYQQRLFAAPQEAAKIVVKDGQIVFALRSGGTDVATCFSDKSPTIIKHIQLKQGDEAYAFSALLWNKGPAYSRVINQVNGADALVFFNEREVFVYTQTKGEGGVLELKEWVYARKPNNANGSAWRWTLTADQMQWPITLDMDAQGHAKVYRNVPIAGMPFDVKARYNFMMQMMLKPVDDIKKYFPFREQVAAIPPMRFWNKEGVQRRAGIGVANTSAPNSGQSKPHPLNFKVWDERWQSVFEVSIKAKPDEYPLLIE